MKKILFTCVSLLIFVYQITADDLADLLQDLAIQTACLGMYSTAQTGVTVVSRYDDPSDWYDPPLLANRFAAMSGAMTRTITFYGVCFDYAQFAWDDIKKYQKAYNDAGMKGQQWYIAAANAGDPYTIILYDPVSREQATTISNGVYLLENSRHKVYTHDGADGHAWLWVQHNNGTWYWIDPTWTDNTGYVWWGKVENGKEVQYYPDPSYCIASDYPRPGVTNSETRSPDSSYTADPNVGKSFANIAYILGYSVPLDFDVGNKYGYSFSMEDAYLRRPVTFLHSLSIDYYYDNHFIEKRDGNFYYSTSGSSLIFGTGMGVPIFSWFIAYAGGGLGFTMYDEGYNTIIDFAWKANGGLRFKVSDFFIKLDVSYGSIIGQAFGIGLGLAF
jgi:hypothetical protein